MTVTARNARHTAPSTRKYNSGTYPLLDLGWPRASLFAHESSCCPLTPLNPIIRICGFIPLAPSVPIVSLSNLSICTRVDAPAVLWAPPAYFCHISRAILDQAPVLCPHRGCQRLSVVIENRERSYESNLECFFPSHKAVRIILGRARCRASG